MATRRSIILLAGLLLAACGDDKPPPEHLKSGKDLYDYYCAPCHKDAGEGTFLRGAPPIKYTTKSYRELVDWIRGHRGSAGSRMPEFKQLSKAQAEAIAIHIRRKLKAE